MNGNGPKFKRNDMTFRTSYPIKVFFCCLKFLGILCLFYSLAIKADNTNSIEKILSDLERKHQTAEKTIHQFTEDLKRFKAIKPHLNRLIALEESARRSAGLLEGYHDAPFGNGNLFNYIDDLVKYSNRAKDIIMLAIKQVKVLSTNQSTAFTPEQYNIIAQSLISQIPKDELRLFITQINIIKSSFGKKKYNLYEELKITQNDDMMRDQDQKLEQFTFLLERLQTLWLEIFI